MNHTFRTINRYHQQFESYKGVISLKSWIFWLSILAIFCFIYSFLWYINPEYWPTSKLNYQKRIIPVMLFECVALLCWFKLQKDRAKKIIEDAKRSLNTKEENLTKLKRLWLEKTLGIPSTQFLELAIDIDKIINLKQKYKSPFSLTSEQLLNLIFSVESKNRVLAMFMGICAALIGLSISAGASINDLFYFYIKESTSSLLTLNFLISLFLILSYMIARYIFLVITTIFSAAINNLEGLKCINNNRAKEFVNDLVILHELPKARIKTTYNP